MGLIMEQHMPFAFETVFSYYQRQSDGTFRSKLETILALQRAGYFVVLLFIGLASAELSTLRVATRRLQGGHNVPEEKLMQRFPRTQHAIRDASLQADMTLMFDNSRSIEKAFTLVRAQAKSVVSYDCRQGHFAEDQELIDVASRWLAVVAPL